MSETFSQMREIENYQTGYAEGERDAKQELEAALKEIIITNKQILDELKLLRMSIGVLIKLRSSISLDIDQSASSFMKILKENQPCGK